jgi:hypothetical protein
MDDQIPWTGGISNRQIFLDTARSVTVWTAVSVSLVVAWLQIEAELPPLPWPEHEIQRRFAGDGIAGSTPSGASRERRMTQRSLLLRWRSPGLF